MTLDAATRAQVHAARPTASTWVSANAGSGKTRVLTHRVARLLLNGAKPHRILCLTYTKAAAAEMQTRLFKELGKWAMLPRPKLMEELRELGVDTQILSEEDIRKARRLFAQALETPGGLKIQTIHAFCGTLLRQFPLEAHVTPGFRELDDLQAEAIQADVLEVMAREDREQIFSKLALHLGDGDLDKLVDSILNHRKAFAAPIPAEAFEDALGEQRGLMLSVMVDDALLPFTRDSLSDFANVLATGGTTDQDIARGFQTYLQSGDQGALVRALLTQSFTKRKRLGTNAIQKARPDIPERLHSVGEELAEAHQRYFTSQAIDRSVVLADFAQAFLTRYAARKAELGVLDFDDLIAYSGALLADPDYGPWVLYRLDGGLDHVLVDEAQDTSPPQWELIKSLTEAFFDGEGSAKEGRSIFVVGDKKQSIYSFQGADPRVFDTVQEYFAARAAPMGEGLVKADLLHSFRTAPPILKLVDAVYGADHPSESVEHVAFHDARPGRVELWPFFHAPEKEDETPWYEPLDKPSPSDPAIQLASEVGRFVAEHWRKGTVLPDTDQPVQPRDFLILVRRRSLIFQGIIKALKDEGVPIAGSDRLNVAGELAVRDLLALLRVTVSPSDDLSLAATLRSPLFGITEGELFTLAHGRKGTLIESLGAQEQFAEIHHAITKLQGKNDYTRPYELLHHILTDMNGQTRLVARLGAEAEDGIDELLAQSLIYEESEAPTISGFLDWIDNDDRDAKRQTDDARNEVRVMTVHGAKGLEAPIVILPDTGKRDFSKNKDAIQLDESGLPFWIIGDKNVQPEPLQVIEEARKTRALQEDLRLLYVAMTRAERWLVVGGFGDRKSGQSGDVNANEGPDSWFGKIKAGLEVCGARSEVVQGGATLYLDADWQLRHGQVASVEPEHTALPDWITHQAEAGTTQAKPLSPSDLGGAHALSSEGSDEDLLQRGTDIHRLLEVLPNHPQTDWQAIAQALLGEAYPELLQEAERTLTASYPIPIFAPDSLREVPIIGTLDAFPGRTLSGFIDRLVITPGAIWAIDYKTHREVPKTPEQTPEALKRQMGAYLALLKQIYPDKPVRVALLWTTTATFMELPHESVMSALGRAAKA